MPKTHSSQPFVKWVAVAAVLAILSACGGGGSNPPPSNPTPTPTPDPDTTPEAFSFTAVTDVERGALVVSDTVTITGIDAETDVSVENGEYSTGGAEFTSEAGTVENGDEIVVRTTASSEFATSVETVLTVGGVSGTFTVTTEARDVTPSQFNFTDETGAGFNEVVESNAVAIEGINDLAPVTIEGGEYAIDSGEFTSASGSIAPGQSIVVRGTSASTVSTGVDVVLTVGEEATGLITDTFTVTTFADTAAPTAEIYYPTSLSMTSGSTVRVRGVTGDDHSSVTAVTVSGIDVTTSDNFATWHVDVPLAQNSENEIVVVTTDSVGNSDGSAASVTVVQKADITGSFPSDEDVLPNPQDLAFDPQTGNLFVSDSELEGIFKIEPVTNLVTPLSTNSLPEDQEPVSEYASIVLDAVTGDKPRLLLAQNGSFSSFSIIEVDLETGARGIVSSNAQPENDHPLGRIIDIAMDDSASRLLVASAATDTTSMGLLSVDLNNGGARDVISDNSIDIESPFSNLNSLTVDSVNQVAYLSGGRMDEYTIWRVDLDSKYRDILAANGIPDGELPLAGPPLGVDLDSTNRRLLFAEYYGDKDIVSINLDESSDASVGTRAVLSDTSSDPVRYTDSVTKILVNEEKNIAYLLGYSDVTRSVLCMDLSSGQQVILVKATDGEPQL